MNIFEAESFLQSRYQQSPQALAAIGHGDWSKAYSFRHKGKDLVARFGVHESDFLKDQVAHRFSCEAMPVPQVLEVGRTDSGFYAISERAFGKMIDDLSAAEWTLMVPAVMRMLVALREADVSFTRGYGMWSAEGQCPYASWRDYLLDVARDDPEQRTHGWTEKLDGEAGAREVFERVLMAVRELVEFCPEERALLHTDLLHFNVLVEPSRICAVVDWGNSQVGDFLYELALFTYYQPYYPATAGIDWVTEAKRAFAGEERFDERLRCYELHLALVGMAYNAFTERWHEFEWNAKRSGELL